MVLFRNKMDYIYLLKLVFAVCKCAALAKRHRGEQEVKQEDRVGCGFIISSLTSVITLLLKGQDSKGAHHSPHSQPG